MNNGTFKYDFKVVPDPNNPGSFIVQGGPYNVGSTYVTDQYDGPGDSATQLGDIPDDTYNSQSEFYGGTAGATYVGRLTGGGFIGKYSDGFTTTYNLYTDNSYQDGANITPDPQQQTTVCYVAGTAIRTTRGEIPVESLSIGDIVITASGACRPIKWLGHRAYSGRFANNNPELLPICFKAGALADSVPVRDLWVSPKHAMFLDGVLIPAAHLVNGATVVKADRVDEVTYWHVELDSHDVLLAEGAPSESFVDDDSRGLFQNAREFDALYSGAPRAAAVYCLPRVEDGYRLEAIRDRLNARAGWISVPAAA